MITFLALTAQFITTRTLGLSEDKKAAASLLSSWSRSVYWIYSMFRGRDCRRLAMMKMRYVGAPTISVITLIGQHDNGCCQLEK